MSKDYTYVRTEIRRHTHAVYARIVFQDAKGKLVYFSASSFKFDLREWQPDEKYQVEEPREAETV